jgi:polyisoprenyl-teichoic acid--peptidoglycan teichoic acid transferase
VNRPGTEVTAPPDPLEEGAEADQGGRSHGRRRRNRRVLVAALVLLLIPVLALAGYGVWLDHIVSSNIKQQTLLPGLGPRDANGDAVPQPSGNGENYLVVGNDAAPGLAGARSDVMVLVHVPADHRDVTLIHFPRDLWVPIPGRGKAKLNASYAFGGAPLLVRTMQNMLGVKIDHVAMLGFENFKNMTDAVGGVNVFVAEPSSSRGHSFEPGITHMNGDAALAFVRERKQLSQGDISRGKRQMAFIKAVMIKGRSGRTLANPVRLAHFLDAATVNLVVDQDLDVGTMRSEAFALRGLDRRDIHTVTAPFGGFGRSADGQSIDVLDEAKMARLGEAIRTDSLESYP